MTQTTTQAIQQAREIAAAVNDEIGYPGWAGFVREGLRDGTKDVQIALQALSVSASEREALEARVKSTVAENNRLRAVLSELVDRDLTYDGGNLIVPLSSHGSALTLANRARAALNGAKP